MLNIRGALAAVMLALVLAPAAMAEKPDETLAKDFAAFDKALEGIDPAIREKISTATLQLLLDTMKLAQNDKPSVASSESRSSAATTSAVATDDEESVASEIADIEEESTEEENPAVLTTDEEEESAEEAEELAEEEEEEAEEVAEEEEEEEEVAEEEEEDKEPAKPKARSGSAVQTSTIAKWQQCGGKGGECHKLGACDDKEFGSKCESGTSCKRHSEW